jgi:hypothetical protein
VRTEAELVIKTQDNPPDDLYAALSEVVEEIIRHFSGHGRARIIGYTVLSPGPSLPPVAFRVTGDGDRHRLSYETIDAGDVLYITARLPYYIRDQPCVQIREDSVWVFIGNRVATIPVKFPVDLTCSHFSVRNGVLDIMVTKCREG